MNATIEKFGYPGTLVREYRHWVVLLRPAQVTAGSLILAAKSDATAFGDLPAEAFVELQQATAEIEMTLSATCAYEKINYLMLMMVDPHVHFHVFPRYDGCRALGGAELDDAGWPGPPDLKSARKLDEIERKNACEMLVSQWRSSQTNSG
jgi:diadenosine tetraphosphate (Ap4A) HIT family hydrolase